MLRAVKNAFVRPRLLGFKATSLSGACTVNIGTDDVASAASAATGKSYLTLADVFGRTPVCVAAAVKDAGNASGNALIDADPTISLLSLKQHDGTNPADGALMALCFGHDVADAGYYAYGRQSAPFTVKSSWNSARVELFKVTPHATTPAINIGAGKATLTRNDTGDYTVTFKRPFSSDNVVAVPTAIGSSSANAKIVSATATAVRVIVCTGGSASDAFPFYLAVLGSDNPQYGARHRKTLRASDRYPRIVAGHVSYSTGTPSITVGTGDFTITDTGTGVLTATFAVPFAREPIVLASQNAVGNVTLNAAATTTGCVLDMFNTGGAATDPTDLHFLVFGFDDADEYAI